MKKSLLYCQTVLFALLVSCSSQTDEPLKPPSSVEMTINMLRGYESANQDITSFENKVNSVSAYLFKGEELIKVYNKLTGSANSIKLQYDNDKSLVLYCIANADHLSHIKGIEAGSISRSDFLKLNSNRQTSLIPEFLPMSGDVQVSASESGKYDLKLNRGMSRVDLLVKAPEIAVNKITICNTQIECYLFSQNPISSVSYGDLERRFETPITSNLSEVAYINEQKQEQLYALVEYTYKGATEMINLKLPNSIVRNSTYQIIMRLSNDPEHPVDPPSSTTDRVVGYIRTVDWNDGGEQPTTPDAYYRIRMDAQRTQIPSNASLMVDDNVLIFKREGGQATLYFTGKFNKDIEVTTADPRLTVTAIDDVYQNAAINIIATQSFGEAEYIAKIRVSKAYVPTDPGTEFTVKVESNEPEYVVMGGLKWLMVNGIGQDVMLYPQLKEGQTPRDYYKKNWKTHTAQTVWGPRPNTGPLPMLYPWESSTTTNIGGGPIFGDNVTTWVESHGNLPCPKGWRLPSLSEFQRIWPVGSANQKYTIQGVEYTCSIEDSGHPDIQLDGTTTTAPTKIFVISDGRQELIFPIAGWRRKDVTTPEHAVEIGTYLNLWTMHRGSNGVSAPAIGIRNGVGYLSSSGGSVDWVLTDAYKNSRCVKDIK